MKHFLSFKLKAAILSVLVVFGLLLTVNFARADINSDCQNESAEQLVAEGKVDQCSQILQGIANSIGAANATNQKNLSALQSQLANLNKRIDSMKQQLTILADSITKRQESLAYTKELFNEKTRDQYTFLRLYDPIAPFLFSGNATEAFRQLTLRRIAADADRKTINTYATDLAKLNDDKVSLQKSKDSLASAQKQVASQTDFLAGEVAKASAYLATLSAKQQSFLAAKLDSLGLSRSAYNMKGGCSDDRNVDPGFSPRIAFFSFGVPNRIGMNQFGAKGRAEAGQNAETILKAYYNADYTTGYNSGITVHVLSPKDNSGRPIPNEYGQTFDDNWNIDDYLKHLYEMPTDFPMEALKAQAIAARSYALAATNNGSGSICASQQCQVVKRELNNGTWQAAVDATKGVVMTTGGNPIKAWFSSTHGGYAYTSADIGWSGTPWTKRMQDTTGGVGGFGDLMSKAYDKSSPVFYCDWGSRPNYNKTAWLKPDELADIANVIMLAKKDGSTQSHLAQLDKTNPDGTDTWDAGRVRTELSNRGGSPISSATDISIGADFGSGKTTTVNINGQTFDGQEFKNYFNLRAPSNIQIVGPLFNVEKR